jgi:hypothetical protein
MRTWLHDSSEGYPEQEIPILTDASVLATSEADGHPIALIFDDDRGPGAREWIAAEPGNQTVITGFHHSHTLRCVTLEVEEREANRIQEVQLCVSRDGGETYRELRRQEFTFSPDGATWECEDWAVAEFNVTHVRLVIKPDKGRTDCIAKLTSLVLGD